MPLFMDLHISQSGDISIDQLIQKHKADLACQYKYGVTFKSVWVNKEKGIVFCLMEAPDKNACMHVHQEAHGDTGCNIVEVAPGEYDTFMANSFFNAHDIAETESGILDTAYRTVLQFEIVNPLHRKRVDIGRAKLLISSNKGTLLLDPHQSVKAVFVYPAAAFGCAHQIRGFMETDNWDYRLTVVAGKPVEQQHNKFYGYVMDLSNIMSISGRQGDILTTHLTLELLRKQGGFQKDILKNTKVLSPRDEQFLIQVMGIIQEKFHDSGFNATRLAALVYQSRSQLFKKVKSITGFTPNTLITEFRLHEGVKLLDLHKDQIAQIAFDIGFNSPSYFTKVFTNRFHILPSNYVNLLKN